MCVENICIVNTPWSGGFLHSFHLFFLSFLWFLQSTASKRSFSTKRHEKMCLITLSWGIAWRVTSYSSQSVTPTIVQKSPMLPPSQQLRMTPVALLCWHKNPHQIAFLLSPVIWGFILGALSGCRGVTGCCTHSLTPRESRSHDAWRVLGHWHCHHTAPHPTPRLQQRVLAFKTSQRLLHVPAPTGRKAE